MKRRRYASPIMATRAPRMLEVADRARVAAYSCGQAANVVDQTSGNASRAEELRSTSVRLSRVADDFEDLARWFLRPPGRWELVATWDGGGPDLRGTVVPASKCRHIRRSRALAELTAWSWSRQSRRECPPGATALPPYRWRVRPLTIRGDRT